MPDWQQIINFGLPMVILAVVGWALWRFGWYTIHLVFGEESKNTRGLAGEWVDSEKEWRGELTTQLKTQNERLELQSTVCGTHVLAVQSMGESLATQVNAATLAQEAAKITQEAARLSAQLMTQGNVVLAKIDDTLEHRTDMLQHTAEGVAQLKACVFDMCDVCQSIVSREFPDSAGDVSGYLLAIKKKVNDEA